MRKFLKIYEDLINAVPNLDTGAALMTPGLHHDPEEFFKLIRLLLLAGRVLQRPALTSNCTL
jgi:hypothetical protein